jgi:hypothetical protein
MARIWDRLAAAGGLLGVALSLGGFAVIAASGFAAQPGASTQDVARLLDEGSTSLALAGIYIDTLGSLFLILFIARLWGTLRQAESQPAWLSVAAFASGILMVVAGLGDKIAYYGIVLAADSGLSAEAVVPLYYIVAGSFLLFQTFGGLFLLATGAAVLHTGALVRWLGWAGIIVGGASIATGAVPGAGFLVFPFFVLTIAAVSVAILRRPLEVAAPPARG